MKPKKIKARRMHKGPVRLADDAMNRHRVPHEGGRADWFRFGFILGLEAGKRKRTSKRKGKAQ